MSSMKMKGPEERRYSLPHGQSPVPIAASEDLHAWSIYRFVDSAHAVFLIKKIDDRNVFQTKSKFRFYGFSAGLIR